MNTIIFKVSNYNPDIGIIPKILEFLDYINLDNLEFNSDFLEPYFRLKIYINHANSIHIHFICKQGDWEGGNFFNHSLKIFFIIWLAIK